MTRRPYPTSAAQFGRRAVAAFKRANPDAADAEIQWVFGPKAVTYPTGAKGYVGRFTAVAPGYHASTIHADCDREYGLSVRPSIGISLVTS